MKKNIRYLLSEALSLYEEDFLSLSKFYFFKVKQKISNKGKIKEEDVIIVSDKEPTDTDHYRRLFPSPSLSELHNYFFNKYYLKVSYIKENDMYRPTYNYKGNIVNLDFLYENKNEAMVSAFLQFIKTLHIKKNGI